MPILKEHLLIWACSFQVHAVCYTSYRLKHWLLIGGIHLMHNFVVTFKNSVINKNAAFLFMSMHHYHFWNGPSQPLHFFIFHY